MEGTVHLSICSTIECALRKHSIVANRLFFADEAMSERNLIDKSQENDYTVTTVQPGEQRPLNLKSAIAGVMVRRGLWLILLPFTSGDEVWVLRNGCL